MAQEFPSTAGGSQHTWAVYRNLNDKNKGMFNQYYTGEVFPGKLHRQQNDMVSDRPYRKMLRRHFPNFQTHVLSPLASSGGGGRTLQEAF